MILLRKEMFMAILTISKEEEEIAKCACGKPYVITTFALQEGSQKELIVDNPGMCEECILAKK